MKTTIILKAAFATLLFAACSSEENVSINAESTASARREGKGIALLQSAASRNLLERYSFTATRGGERVTITTNDGININIDPSRLRLNGQPVTGRIDVEFKAVLDRGTMVLANKTTTGYYNGQDLQSISSAASDDADAEEPQRRALVSGGEFYVNMKREGQNLDNGIPYQLEVPAEITGGADDQMIVWKGAPDNVDDDGDGNVDENADVKWTKDTDQNGDDRDVPVDPEGFYVMDLFSWGWSNIDRFRSYPGDTVPIYVELPAGYDDHNAKVYLAWPNDNSIANLDVYDPLTQQWTEHSGLVPDNMQCYIIAVAYNNGGWEMGYQSVTITANTVVTFGSGDLAPVTDTALIGTLNGLP